VKSEGKQREKKTRKSKGTIHDSPTKGVKGG